MRKKRKRDVSWGGGVEDAMLSPVVLVGVERERERKRKKERKRKRRGRDRPPSLSLASSVGSVLLPPRENGIALLCFSFPSLASALRHGPRLQLAQGDLKRRRGGAE